MCWMTLRTEPDALPAVADDLRVHERANGHSWGVAVAIDGELLIQKGVGYLPDAVARLDADAEADAALGHTRYATRGVISGENAHPFPVHNEAGDIVAALAHNGTWVDAPTDGTDRCDSYFIAKELESRYQADPDRPFADHIRETGEYVGETITVLHRDGRAFVYAGRFEITAGETDADADQRSFDAFRSAADLDGDELSFSDARTDGSGDEPLREAAADDAVDYVAASVARSSGGTTIPKGTVVRVEP